MEYITRIGVDSGGIAVYTDTTKTQRKKDDIHRKNIQDP